MRGQGRRGGGGVEGGNRGYEAYYCGLGTEAPNIKGIESSVPIASVQVLEHHHPTMSMLWVHGYQLKNKQR